MDYRILNIDYRARKQETASGEQSMKRTIATKILGILLSVTLIFTMMPQIAFAVLESDATEKVSAAAIGGSYSADVAQRRCASVNDSAGGTKQLLRIGRDRPKSGHVHGNRDHWCCSDFGSCKRV